MRRDKGRSRNLINYETKGNRYFSELMYAIKSKSLVTLSYCAKGRKNVLSPLLQKCSFQRYMVLSKKPRS